MKISGSVAVVTGGGGGIGSAIARELNARGAANVVVADIDRQAAESTAESIGGHAIAVDLSTEEGNSTLVDDTFSKFGRLDIFFANAGVALGGGPDAPDADWDTAWRVNVMSHVWTARHLIPRWLAGEPGHIITTASAAGLLTNLAAAPYAVTKAGAVAFADWLAVTYGDDGVGVSCICPLGVDTRMVPDADNPVGAMLRFNLVSPEHVATVACDAVENGDFLVLPHPEVADYVAYKAKHRVEWIEAMRRLQAKLFQGAGS